MANNNSTKLALYARVSTKNNGQNPETQLLALREYAKARGFDVFKEYVDTSTPMGKMVFTVIGAVAELERSLIKERVVMGLERAKKDGKRLGRPTPVPMQISRGSEGSGTKA